MKSLLAARLVSRLTLGRVKYGWWTAPWTSEERPIVIGGAPRSGTTLLCELLNAHCHLCVGFESAILTNNRRFAQMAEFSGLSPGLVRDIFHRSVTVGDFFERFNKTLMEKAGKRAWGEKMPIYVNHLPLLFRCFPRACFIHLIRDGRDVVCSLRTHPRYRRVDGRRVETGVVNPWNDCIERWVGAVRNGLDFAGDPRTIEVRYERLIGWPEAVLRDLFDRLGFSWDPLVLERYRTERYFSHPRLAEPIGDAAVGRWRYDLPHEARRLFRGTAGDLLSELGYVADQSWIVEPMARRSAPVSGMDCSTERR